MQTLKFHKIVAIAVLLVTAVWVATGKFSSVRAGKDDPKAPKVASRQSSALKTVKATVPARLSYARIVRIAGQTQPDKRVVLGARVASIVEELPVTEGTHVKEGDVILKLQAEGKEEALESARKALVQREAEANATERLSKSGNVPILKLDAARSALASAHSVFKIAQADLDRTLVRAPFPGIIDRVHVERGSAIAPGTEVATLLKLDPILSIGEISERDVGIINKNREAKVRLVSGKTLKGKIRYISRVASGQTRTYRTEIAIPNPGNVIPSGMTTEIVIEAQPVDAVALPRSAITLNREGKLGVRAVDAAGQVAFHPINIVDDTPQALYLGGVPKGVRIIVSGQDLVTDGEKVSVEEANKDTLRDPDTPVRKGEAR